MISASLHDSADTFIRRFKSMHHQKPFDNRERLNAAMVWLGDVRREDISYIPPFHVITTSEIWVRRKLGCLLIIPTSHLGCALALGLDEDNNFELAYRDQMAIPPQVAELGYELKQKYTIQDVYEMLERLNVRLTHHNRHH